MQHDAAYSTGLLLGRITALLIPVVSIILCSLSFRRRRANVACLLSLILFMAAWFIAMLPQLFSLYPPAPGALAAGCISVLVMVASIVLAIVGLVQFRRHYRHGRKRAILTLCLNGLFLLLVVAIVARSHGRLYQRSHIDDATRTFTSTQYNFRMAVPSPWVQLPAGSLISTSALSMTRGNPAMCFTVMAERPGIETTPTLDSVLQVVKARVQSVASSVNFLRETPARLHEMDGIRLDYTVSLNGQSYSYAEWLTVCNGQEYQLLAWTTSDSRGPLDTEVQELFDGFQLIDSNLVVHSAGYRAARNYVSLSNGFTVKTAGSAWDRQIDRLFAIAPDAEYGVQDKNNDSLLVLPFPLGGHDPSVGYLATAFLQRFEVLYPGDSILSSRQVARGPMKGIELTFTRNHNGLEYRSIAQVLKRPGFGCMIIATTSSQDGSKDPQLEDGLNRVEFDDTPVSLDPKLMTSGEKKNKAVIFNELGLLHYRDKHFKAAAFNFREARLLAPGDAMYALNATDAAIDTGMYQDALDDLNLYLGRHQPPAKLQLRLAFLQSRTGKVDDALLNYETAFGSPGTRDDDYFVEYISLLMQSKQHDTAIKKALDYLEQGDSVSVRILLATAYRKAGRVDDALKVLRDEQDKYPENAQLGASLVETLIAAKRFSEAETQCDSLTSGDSASATGYFLKGEAEYGLKHYRESKASFEQALKLNPSNGDAKEFLDHVSGMLGEGSNTALETPITPVSIPAEVLASSTAGAAAPQGSGGNGYGAWYKSDLLAIEYIPGKQFKQTEREDIKILDESGVTTYSSFELPYDPLDEGVYINELTVRDGSGAIVSTGTVSDYYVMDESTAGAGASQAKIIHIPVSGLRPGCEITFVCTRSDNGVEDGFRFTSHLFSKLAPVAHSAVFLRAPAGSFKCETIGNVRKSVAGDGLCWSIDNSAAYRWEPMQANVDTFLPAIWFNDSKPAWKEIAGQYLDSIKDRLVVDDRVRKAAAANTVGAKEDDARVAALAKFVQKSVTYNAIEFGRRARIPNSAATTLANCYGDCKDHAVMLRALLEASGIPAQLALVSTKSTLREDMPSLDQFNHMIVYVPSLRGGSFVDCTDKYSDITRGTPFGLAGRQALALDEKNPRLVTIPDYAHGSNQVVSNRQVEILNKSDASIHEDLQLKGAAAAALRGLLDATDAGNRQILLQRELSKSDPAVELQDMQLTNLDDPAQPLQIHSSYLVKGKFHQLGDHLIGQLPALWERMLLAVTMTGQSRVTPFEVSIPVTVQSDVTVAMPGGYVAEPAQETDFHHRFAACTTTSHEESSSLRIQCSIDESGGRFPPAEYPSYQSDMTSALAAIERSIVLQPAPR